MTPTLTDADREAIADALQEWKRAPHGCPTAHEFVYAAGLAAGMERAAKVCDDFPNWGEECEQWAAKFAAAIREQAKGD